MVEQGLLNFAALRELLLVLTQGCLRLGLEARVWFKHAYKRLSSLNSLAFLKGANKQTCPSSHMPGLQVLK